MFQINGKYVKSFQNSSGNVKIQLFKMKSVPKVVF